MKLDFPEFFISIGPRIYWVDSEGWWHCLGCGIDMDKFEKERHYPFNCSLSKLPVNRRIRQIVIKDNFELYQKYAADRGVKVSPEVELELKPFPLRWYKNQLKNYAKLPIS